MTETVLSQLDAVARLIQVDENLIAEKRNEWESAAGAGDMARAIACETAIADAERSIARLTIRKTALDAQAGAERAAQKAQEVQHLKDAAVQLGDKFLTELGKVAHEVSVVTDRTYALAQMAEQVATARRTASKAGVVWDVKFDPKSRLQSMLQHANNNAGNCENMLRNDWH